MTDATSDLLNIDHMIRHFIVISFFLVTAGAFVGFLYSQYKYHFCFTHFSNMVIFRQMFHSDVLKEGLDLDTLFWTPYSNGCSLNCMMSRSYVVFCVFLSADKWCQMLTCSLSFLFSVFLCNVILCISELDFLCNRMLNN